MGCKEQAKGKETVADPEKTPTHVSDSLTVIESSNGKLAYTLFTMRMERYELASEPFMEFPKGIDVKTFNDSTGLQESRLTANYAIFLENRKLWEARGNVIAVNARGQILRTEQLFWDQVQKKIFSQVESRVIDGEDVMVGDGFESDEKFEEWVFRNAKGRIALQDSPFETLRGDSTATSDTATRKP